MTRTRKPVTLPTKASDLLELAVKDARVVAKRKGYVLDMTRYHVPNGVCRVCMAGAVMTRTLRVPRTTSAPLFSDIEHVLGFDGAKQMEAIDSLRKGEWPCWWPLARYSWEPAMDLIADGFTRSLDGGRAKWSTYLKAAKMLRAVGL